MNNITEQTIRQYANVSKISLSLVLNALEKLGISRNADDVIDPFVRQKLPEILKSELEAMAIILEKITAKCKSESLKCKSESLAYAESKASQVIDERKKIGQLIDVCFKLIPGNISIFLSQSINNQVISDFYIQYYYEYLKTSFSTYRIDTKEYIINKMEFPVSIIKEYKLCDNMDFFAGDIYSLNKKINELKKQKSYTAALINIVHFLINFQLIPSTYFDPITYNFEKLDFQYFSFIGELLIDMGVIDSALKLYAIDERIFNNPNRLSLLASNAIRIGDLESSTKLITKLLEQEPYHPSVPAIQSEIKRLEQRYLLNSTISIDFSKVDALSGIEFENLLLDKFVTLGFKVESTPKTGDFGADLIVENNEGSRIIVQCKRFKSKVNLKAVQEVVGAMGHYAGDYGVVITNNTFLNSAVKLAESHDIELWDGDRLVSFLAGDLSFSEIIGIS